MELNQFKNNAKCAICGAFIFIIFANTTLFCEKCLEHPHDHLPETSYSAQTNLPTIVMSDTATSARVATTQPSPLIDS